MSVARNRGIHRQAPGVDSAGHALAGFHALLPQPLDHVQAANAVMAEDDQRALIGFGFERLQLAGDAAHGDQIAAFDPGQREFLRLAYVDQMQLLSGIDSALNLLGRDFHGERHKLYATLQSPSNSWRGARPCAKPELEWSASDSAHRWFRTPSRPAF